MNPAQAPDVLALPLASRDDAVAALQQIAEQGEAHHSSDPEGPSHFARSFLSRIYVQMRDLAEQGNWSPSRPVATNPYVSLDPTLDPAQDLEVDAVDAPHHRSPGTPVGQPAQSALPDAAGVSHAQFHTVRRALRRRARIARAAPSSMPLLAKCTICVRSRRF
ncbi:hypothetical protein PEC18_35025 [Paucibacter sp. O1-1]|nr:hypothetical protein [Paucibacter sp. O1-1]MDA3830890.1 hypothetical protein [Paucibacter sp. O1-1]